MKKRLGERLNVRPVRVAEMDPVLRTMLEKHRCTVEENNDGTFTVTYPEGTTKQEWYPRTLDVQYRILLPDGFEAVEVEFFSTEKQGVFAVIG